MLQQFKIVLVLCVLTVPFCVQGQGSASIPPDHREKTFSEAIHLFEQQQYSLAQNLFENFLTFSQNDELEKTIQAEYYICLSSLHLHQTDFESKLKEFVNKYPNHLKTTDIKYHIGSLYFNRGNQRAYRKAEKHLIKVVSKNPKTQQEFDANYKLAYAYMKTKRPSEAIDYFETLTNPNNPNFHSQEASYYLGVIFLYEKKKYIRASKHFGNALSHQKLQKSAYNLLTKSYFSAGDYQNGKKYWQLMEKKKFSKEEDLIRIATNLAFKTGEYTDVIDFVTGEKKEVDLQIMLGLAYLNLGQTEKAIDAFLDLETDEVVLKQEISYNLGMAYLENKNYSKAAYAFAEASHDHFENLQMTHKAALYWAKSAFEAQNYPLAIEAATKYRTYYGKKAQHSDEMLAILLTSDKNLGNYNKVLAHINEQEEPSIESQLTYQGIAHQKAESFYSQQKYVEAMAAFEASFRFKNRDEQLEARAYLLMGNIALKKEAYSKAESYYNKIPKNADLYKETLYYKGYLARNQNKQEEALHYFFQYISKSNLNIEEHKVNYLDGLVRLADAYAFSGEYSKANQTYRRALNNGYEKLDYILYSQGRVFFAQGDHKPALHQFDQLIYDYQSSAYLYESYYYKAMILKEQHKRKESLAIINQLLDKVPHYDVKIKAYYQKAVLHSGLDENKLAIENYSLVLELSSSHPLSNKALIALNDYQNSGYQVRNLVAINKRFEQINPNNKTLLKIRFENAKNFASSSEDIAEIKHRLKPFLKEDSPFFNEANYFMGLAYQKQDDKSGMLEYYKKTKGIYREKVLLSMAEIELDRKNFNSAIEHYGEAYYYLKGDNERSYALQGIISAYAGVGEWEALEQKVNELAKKDVPTMFSFVQLYKGKILTHKKQYAEAIKVLEKAQGKGKNKENLRVILELGNALSLNGEYKKSTTILKDVKAFYSDFPWSVSRAQRIIDSNNRTINQKH